MEKPNSRNLSEIEFIALMAFMMASVALSIDMVLPGLSQIGLAYQQNSTDLQGIITMIFLGLGLGQLFFGPLSDSFGRKPIVYAGIAIYVIASWICIQAESLEIMLFGRLVQGLGLSGPRSVLISIIRNLYKGDYMGRIMSFITVIFILVPMIAPILGQFILDYFHWHGIFYFQMLFVIVLLFWFGIQQEETLLPSNRIQLTRHLYINGTKEFFKQRGSVIYTLISGLTLGSFMVFLSSSQQIFQNQYGMVQEYAYIFAGLSFWAGFATFVNGMLVLRFGMTRLTKLALYLFIISALVYSVFFFNSANPKLWVILLFMSIQFIAFGFIYGNVRAMAMEPLGHIAGIGSALNGFISTLMAVPIAMLIGQFIDKTALPLFFGFLGCGVVSVILLLWIKEDLVGRIKSE